MSEGFALWDAAIGWSVQPLARAAQVDRDIASVRFADLARLSYGACSAAIRRASRTGSPIARRHREPRGPRELHCATAAGSGISEFRTAEGGTVGIYTDITEAKRRQRAIEQRRAAPAGDDERGGRRHRHRRPTTA